MNAAPDAPQTSVETLADALPREIARAQELLEAYASIGPAGLWGYQAIKHDIETAIRVSAEGDTVGMIRSLGVLRALK